ncbi:MAG: hypothetical protein QE283_06640 [Rhodoferax sp.]|nr:hypothetical protein [Rhodoferax sp.]
MFGLFNDKRLLEQKKMIWQNLFASLDFIKVIEEREETERNFFGQDKVDLNKRLIEKLKSIHSLSSNAVNNGNHKKSLDKANLNYIQQDNKILRDIYDSHISGGAMFGSFDDYINPSYGWDVALRDWN